VTQHVDLYQYHGPHHFASQNPITWLSFTCDFSPFFGPSCDQIQCTGALLCRSCALLYDDPAFNSPEFPANLLPSSLIFHNASLSRAEIPPNLSTLPALIIGDIWDAIRKLPFRCLTSISRILVSVNKIPNFYPNCGSFGKFYLLWNISLSALVS
jgi:hypothetical protein